MIRQLLLVLVVASSLLDLHTIYAILCTGPTTTVLVNSTEFNITGPCPNYTVLAPVGSTVQYRCDYMSTETGYMPYWYIPALNKAPFLKRSDHVGIIVISSASNNANGETIGHTTISLQIKKNYLLTLQCGLTGVCSAISCIGDIDSENITSNQVELVSFGKQCMQ